MKRVAVCISGLVRDFENSSKNLIENLLNQNTNYKFDFFLDTWNVKNSKNSQMYLRGDIDNRSCYNNFDYIDVNKLISIYNPISLTVDNINNHNFDFANQFVGMGNNPIAVFSQFFKMKKCAESLLYYINNNSVTYDMIIRTRFDLKMNKINLHLFNIDKKIAYLETDGCPSNWASDKFCITNLEGYNAYYKFYDNLIPLINKNKTTIPEYLLYDHLIQNNVEVNKTNLIGRLGLL